MQSVVQEIISTMTSCHYVSPILIKSLPAIMPFVGPETMERRTGVPYLARIGANESVFGPSPKAIEAMELAGVKSGNMRSGKS